MSARGLFFKNYTDSALERLGSCLGTAHLTPDQCHSQSSCSLLCPIGHGCMIVMSQDSVPLTQPPPLTMPHFISGERGPHSFMDSHPTREIQYYLILRHWLWLTLA